MDGDEKAVVKAVRQLVDAVEDGAPPAVQNEAVGVLLDAVMGSLANPVRQALARVMVEVRNVLRERARTGARASRRPRRRVREPPGPKPLRGARKALPAGWVAPVTPLFPDVKEE